MQSIRLISILFIMAVGTLGDMHLETFLASFYCADVACDTTADEDHIVI